jgi:hypothetical protein
MDGTPASHDSWLVSPLKNDFKHPAGNLNESSQFLSTLTCTTYKFWTPIAPAIEAATDHLNAEGRPDAGHYIVFMGDGGANSQPMLRDSNGNSQLFQSWYTPSPGNSLRPCHDALGQAQIAKDAGIEIFTIGYDLNASTANTCYQNNRPLDSSHVEPGINARETISGMASPGGEHFFEKATPGEVRTIFEKIGRLITSGGTRLIE